jgi:hypothetical protein
MEHSRPQYARKGVNMGNIIGDPFALATISISAVSAPLILAKHRTIAHTPFSILELQTSASAGFQRLDDVIFVRLFKTFTDSGP